MRLTTALATLLSGLAAAKKCMNATVPVDVYARTGVFGNIEVPQTNPEATAFIQALAQQGRNYTAVGLTGYATTAKTYDISAQFCTPDNPQGSNPTVQVLTHGIGFDKTYVQAQASVNEAVKLTFTRYWDLPFNNFNYSYVEAVTRDGYCTLSYDRLGIGNSSHGEPLNEIQAALEVGALYELTMMLRTGQYPGVPQAFQKVVHVGHSFGSAQTFALASMYPTASDAIVLTGFSTNMSFSGLFLAGGNFMQANLVQPHRFGNCSGGQDLLNGYLLSGNAAADQLLFLQPGYFDPMIAMAAEHTKQPVTVGELLTLGSAPMMNPYARPVLIVTGGMCHPSMSGCCGSCGSLVLAENDVPFCGGKCLAMGDPSVASIPAAANMAFPSVDVTNFTAYIQPNTAHGINLHYNSTGAYKVIDHFIGSKGLAAS